MPKDPLALSGVFKTGSRERENGVFSRVGRGRGRADHVAGAGGEWTRTALRPAG